MDIGRPKRIIEVEPASTPLPETIPLPVAPEPAHEPASAPAEPASP